MIQKFGVQISIRKMEDIVQLQKAINNLHYDPTGTEFRTGTGTGTTS